MMETNDQCSSFGSNSYTVKAFTFQLKSVNVKHTGPYPMTGTKLVDPVQKVEISQQAKNKVIYWTSKSLLPSL